MLRRRHLVTAGLLAPAVILLIALFSWPLFQLVERSFTHPNGPFVFYARIFEVPAYLQILWRTFMFSAATALICFLIGYPVAYKLATARPFVKAIILVCVLIPFWTNVLVRTYGWILLLNPKGLINTALLQLGVISSPLPIVYNTTGVLIGMSHVMLPFMILPLYAVMTRLDAGLLHASRSLGAGPIRTFVKVYLPLTMPGAMAGFLLVFMISLGFFVVPAVLGGAQGRMLAQLIEFNINTSLNWGMAATLSTALLIVTLFLYWIGDRFFNLGAVWGLDR
jgi:putative spermidine/putrescine transport system permease protein